MLHDFDQCAVRIRPRNAKHLDTCCSAPYMSQTRDQHRFTISELVADWHKVMVTWHIVRPFTVRDNENKKLNYRKLWRMWTHLQ